MFTVETGLALEHYFPRLPGADGSGSSCSVGVGSSIASSTNDLEKMNRALYSVCPAQRKRKLLQPRSGLQRRSNPGVKLLTPSPNVQDVTGKGDQEHGIGATKEVSGGSINISTTVDTIMLDSGGEEKDDGDGDDDFQPKSSRKLSRKT